MNAIADHLWQSTWFALAAWLLTLLLRKDSARVRYWIWFAASMKFLVPFAWLSWIGNHFVLQLQDRPVLLPLVQQVAAPLAGGTVVIADVGSVAKYAMLVAWMLGSFALLVRWMAAWRHSCAVVKTSDSCDVGAPIAVRCSDRLTEPAVVGIFKPVIVLPRYALRTLTPAQIDAVVAHEAWHARRRDNLAASLHAVVQALFWFHPLVWWIGAKLIREREYACDEGAIQDGHEPVAYAKTLLRVCRYAVASRDPCTAGAVGGDLKDRVRAILSERIASRAATLRQMVVTAVLLGCIALPVAWGMTVVATSELRLAAGSGSMQISTQSVPTYVVVRDDYVYANNVSIRELISQVYAVDPREVRGRERGLDYPRYDVALRAVQDASGDERQLVAELLKRQFNLELLVWPPAKVRYSQRKQRS